MSLNTTPTAERIHIGIFGRFGNIHRGIEAGNGQLQIPQLTDGCRHTVLMEGTAAAGQGGEFVQIVDFNAGELHFQRAVQQLLPA